MNYKKIYDNIVNIGLSRGRSKSNLDYYVERHHIIPKCMGGTDDKTNLVLLTAREHFVAHQLLLKMHPSHQGLAFAVYKFTHGTQEQIKNSRAYSWIKTANSKARSNLAKTLWENTPEIERKRRMVKANLTRSKQSPEYKAEIKEKRSKAQLSHEKIECPHCKTKCRPAMYARFHGEKCKVFLGIDVHVEPTRKCPHCLKIATVRNFGSYHGIHCRKNPHRIPRAIYKCEYCDFETENKGLLTRFHNNNCKRKPK